MHLFFIDESGTIPPKNKHHNSDFFALGGLVVPEDLWHEIDKELTIIKDRFKITGEIKWRFFSPQKPNTVNHSFSNLTANEKSELRIAIYRLLMKFESVRSIIILINIPSAYKLNYIQNENDLYWFAYEKIMERFQYYLEDLSRLVGSKINGIIVCDHRQPKDDSQLRHFHQNLLIGSKENISIYKNLVEGVFLTPSHLSLGIQLADMIVGGVYRQFARKDPRYFDLLKPLFRKGPDGLIEGHDLILWPRNEKDAVSRNSPEPTSIDVVTAQI